MTHPAHQIAPAPPNSWHMIRALGGIGILCALLIVTTYQLTLPTILKNRAEALEAAIFRVLPGTERRITFTVNPDGSLTRGDDPELRHVYAGYAAGGSLVGVAVPASGQGFQDILGVLYGYSLDKQAIIGIQVLESKETPGLGDKIEKDADFVANFDNLDVSLTEDLGAVKNPIETVKKGSKTEPWQIDAITGATISSKAIGQILRDSTTELIPIIMKHAGLLRAGDGEMTSSSGGTATGGGNE